MFAQVGLVILMNLLVQVQALQSSGSCSGGSGYTDESSCVGAGYYAVENVLAVLATLPKVLCTGAGETTPGYCSNSSYTDAASCTGAGTYTPGYCSNSSYTDANSCTGAGYFGSPYCSDSQYGTREIAKLLCNLVSKSLG